jgi:adenine-specific DNA-methyltransferase
VITVSEVQTETGVDKVLTVWRDAEDLDLEKEADWFEENFDAASFDRIYLSSENYVNEADPVEPTFRERMEADVDDA